MRVVIFGTWSTDWMQALGPDSELWINHPFVREVSLVDDKIRLIVPPSYPQFRTVVLPLMEWHISTCPKDYPALVPSDDAMKILSQKDRFHQYIYQMGLSHLVPKIFHSPSEVRYPFILKRIDLNGGDGVAFVQSPAALNYFSQQEAWRGRPVLLQEYVEGDKDYVSHLICKNGDILWHSSLEYTLLEAHKIRSFHNITKMRRVALDQNLLRQFVYCLKPLKFSGPCNIDFKITPAGGLKILEINPRLGGSLMQKENRDLLKEAIDHILIAA